MAASENISGNMFRNLNLDAVCCITVSHSPPTPFFVRAHFSRHVSYSLFWVKYGLDCGGGCF